MIEIDAHHSCLSKYITDIKGQTRVKISSIVQDSRLVKNQGCFVAIHGQHSNGHHYIPQACEAGASLVIHEEPFQETWGNYSKTSFWHVSDSRKVFSYISSAINDFPAKKIPIIGVTGTDGKSTTVSLVHQLLTATGLRAGFISTVNMHDGISLVKNDLRQSTPEADTIQEILKTMVDNQCDCAVIEATSHGLSPKTSRLADVYFATAIITNISHEHLEFHGSFEQYKKDKSELFKKLGPANGQQPAAIINADDPNCMDMAEVANTKKIITYSTINSKASIWAEDIKSKGNGSDFFICTPDYRESVHTELIGEINIANILAAIAAVHSTFNTPLSVLAKAVPNLSGPPGRMNRIECGQPFTCIIDYAHTPGSFEKIFPMLRQFVDGRLISVFGSAGERDKGKRPMQGKIADQYCDLIILTDEDPRNEDQYAILTEIAAGISKKTMDETLFLIPDRKQAIKKACEMANENDLLIILGKGHEGSIIQKDRVLPWDEEAVLREILQEMNIHNTGVQK
ncbi:MAG: UDP-N-acetylmuramoyl-L-alanyl-D-glutamate--2,6-diaminopimelate ligase [Spirochaetaceae bacterium]|nr:MAG: UDP-N-acetylmuramoyl-L-alanyl-D-glutamate--2,6-diaminopimelate ligase [Spirochaetaceae bacterium]